MDQQYSETDKNKLVSTTWYRGDFFDYGDNYKISLESTGNPYVGRVGLIRLGEILSNQSETMLSKNHTIKNDYQNVKDYFISNSFSITDAWIISVYGASTTVDINQTRSIRPVINIGPNVQILGGNGTFNEPFQI